MPEPLTTAPPDVVAHGFTSTGGYVLRATDGNVPLLFVADSVDVVEDPIEELPWVRLEGEEAAVVAVWLLRCVTETLPEDSKPRVKAAVDQASRLLGEALS